MQQYTDEPRDDLTTEQVIYLIQEAPATTWDVGCELIDKTLNIVEDFSADFRPEGEVARNAYANIHGTARFLISRELPWGSAIIRPYVVISDGDISARFNLGAYFTTTPTTSAEEDVRTWDVEGYDIIHGLADPVGETYAVTQGTPYLQAVQEILDERGYVYVIDQSAAASTLPTDRVWPLDPATTYLTVVNDLLASIGYQGIWSDWNGRLQCLTYQPPRARAPEWTYETGALTSMMTTARSFTRDYFNAPNRWVFYINSNIEENVPVEGNGIFSYTNDNEGDTSVAARGRVITHVEGVDVADQAALVALAEQRIDTDMRLKTAVAVGTFPNPLHWHFDRLYLNDPDLTGPADILSTGWTLPLDGSDMSHEWTVIDHKDASQGGV